MKRRLHPIFSCLLAVTMVIASMPLSSYLKVNAADDNNRVNFALNRVVTASSNGGDSYGWTPDKAVDGIVNRDAPKASQSRWSAEAGAPQWLKVDLGFVRTFDEFKIAFEVAAQKASKFHIDVSNDDVTYATVYAPAENAAGFDLDTIIHLEEAVSGRYVKFTFDKLITNAYASVSIYEFSVIGSPDYTNLALDATASASGVEANNFAATKANDGIVNRSVINAEQSRWSSDVGFGQKWLQLTFSESTKVASIILDWERKNATAYEIQYSDDGTNWKPIVGFKKVPSEYTQKINFPSTITTKYLRLVIDEFLETAPPQDKEEVIWKTVSVYEFEAFKDALDIPVEPEMTPVEVAKSLEIPEVGAEDISVRMPEVPEGMNIEFIGADYEQILASDLTITKPLTQKTLTVNFKVFNDTSSATSPNMDIVIPGLYEEDETSNEKPEVLPELQEWHGGQGQFIISDSSKIVVDPASGFTSAANEFAKDFKAVTGKAITVVSGTDPAISDFYFTKNTQALDSETYYMEVSDHVTIRASENTGAYWGTRTILQILKQTGTSIVQGVAKDYPKFNLRGLMIDVGRKPLTLDFLKDIAKMMSWYKLNDFSVHLNDNSLDNMPGTKDPYYAGFRLQSDIPNLTNTDVSYTKEEFRNFIKNSREIGVNIIPEFDSPGHSGAFTRANPSIARNDNHQYLDVLNPNTLPFIKSVYDEYMDGEEPVFDDQTVVNIGTDEYKNGNKEGFRAYQDALLRYIRDDKGRTPRVWGSQSENAGTTPITVDGVQMILWYPGYANPKEMYEKGYDCINMSDGDLYIVPGAGYYNDYLSQNHILNSWEPNIIENGFEIPVGSSQMLGADFAVWNDTATKDRDVGMSDVEIFDRIYAIMPTFAIKLWGDVNSFTTQSVNKLAAKTGIAPNANPLHQIKSKTNTILNYNFNNKQANDKSGNAYHSVDQENVAFAKGKTQYALTLQGDKSYVETPLTDLGVGSSLDFWVKKDGSDSGEQILFESEIGSIKASQKDTGKFGFTRDFRDYSFNYILPDDVWTQITLKTSLGKTALYVDGIKVDEVSRSGTGGKHASLVIPLKRIGSKNHAFKGQIDEIKVMNTVADVDPTLIPHSSMSATATSANADTGSEGPASYVLDDNVNTIWHTNYTPTPDSLPQSLTIKMDKAYMMDEFDYLPRSNGGNGTITKYDLEVSTDGVHFNKVVENGTWVRDATLKKVVFENPVSVQYVRLTVLEASGNFGSCAEINIHKADNKADLRTAYNAALAMDEESFSVESFGALNKVLEEAVDILNNDAASDEEVATITAKLATAMEHLVNVDDLIMAMGVAEEYKEADYTTDSFAVLKAALADAKQALINGTKETVKAAQTAIEKAIEKLVLKGEEDTTFMKSILLSAISKANVADTSGQLDKLAPIVKELVIARRNVATIVYNNAAASNEQCFQAWFDLANILQYLDFVADKDALLDLIKIGNDINTDEYKEGVEAFKAALVAAQSVYDRADVLQESIDNAYEALEKAIAGLVKNDAPDKKLLEITINKIVATVGDGSKYKQDDSYRKFAEALAYAKEVFNNPNAPQEQINSALHALIDAYENIRLLPTEEQLAQLEAFVTIVNAMNRNTFTEEQLKQIDSVLTEVNAMLGDFDEKQFDSLQSKMADMLHIINDVESRNPVNPIKPVDPSAVANTSDATNAVAILMMLMVSGCGVILLQRKRKHTA